jgi:CBS domain-containing protein
MLLASAIIIDLRARDVEAPSDVLARLGPFATLLLWLGPVNITVGVFNLIPGFPLDGGRILRAIIWKVTGSLRTATRIAGASGRGVGWILIALGVAMAFGYRVPFFGRGLTSGLWLGLIGLFLRNAAIAHLRGAVIEEALLGVRVMDLMRTTGSYVDANLPIRNLVEDWLMRHEEGAYPVFENGGFVGIVTMDDVRKVAAGDWWRSVREVLTPAPQLVSASPAEDLSSALQKLGTSGVRQLPVMHGGALVGILYEKDVARWLELRGQALQVQPVHVRHA